MLDGERGERRTAGVIFVGRRRAEQCHETVTKKLIDGPFVSVDFRHRDGKELVQKGMHSFRADARGQRRRSGQIAEKHGHQLALAFDGRWRAEEVRPRGRRCVSRDSADARGCGMLAIGSPHARQKFAAAGLISRQDGQGAFSAAPHSLQKAASTRSDGRTVDNSRIPVVTLPRSIRR